MIAQLAAAIAILTGPAGLTNDATPTFTFTGADECRVDTGAWTACAEELTTPALADGGHVFRVRSATESAYRSFTVDTVAPSVAVDGDGELHAGDTTATLSFSSPEDGVDLACAVDGAAPAPCTSPFTTPDLANGTHAFNVVATDGAGNASTASRLVVIDAGPPETTLDGPEGSIKDRRPVYAIASSRARSHFQCKLDESGAWGDCDASYQPQLTPGKHTVFARAIDAAGNVDPSPAAREVDVRDCTDKVTIGVVEAVADCFYKDGDLTVADGSVKINGLTFNAIGGTRLEFDVPHKRLLLRKGQLKIGSTVLYQGELKWTVPDGDRVTLASLDLATFSRTDAKPDDSEAALDLRGDDDANVKGFDLTGSAKLELAKGGQSILTGTVALPKVFTDAEGNGLTGSISIAADNERGVHLSGMQIRAPLVFVGKVEVHGLYVNFNGERNGDAKSTCNQDSPGLRWEGGAQSVVLPTPDHLTITNVGAGFADGAFNYAKGTLETPEPGMSIGAGIRVQKIAIAVCAGPPVTVEGRVGMSALNGKLKIPDGGLLFKGGDPWSLRAEAPLATLALDRTYTFKDVYVQYASSGAVDFGARLQFSLGVKGALPVGSLDAAVNIDAGVKGFLQGGDFNADIDATGCFAGKFTVADTLPVSFSDICPNVKGVVSSKGIALCGGLKVKGKDIGSVGAGYAWGGELKFMAGTCDLGAWTVVRSAGASAAGAKVVRLRGGRAALVAVRGIGGAPQVELHGPGGAIVRTPDDAHAALKSADAIAFSNAGTKTTYVVLAHPRPGRWTVKGTGIADVRTAGMRPAPKVSATLRGGKLRYRVARVKGQRVTFEEHGRGVSRALATVTGGRGALRFTPADGAGGAREIDALVEQDGLPRKRMTVARFIAPARAKPAQPRGVKIAREGGKTRAARIAAARKPALTITWRASKGAARYGVRVSLEDGRRLFFLTDAKHRVVRIPDAGNGRVRVRIVGLRADNTSGAAATADWRTR